MKNKIIISFSLLVLMNLSCFAFGREENWFAKISKIKIGVSTRQEVETLFNSPVINSSKKFSWNENVYYKTPDGSLEISYSLNKCSDWSNGYDLEKGTVISVFFRAFKGIRISKLRLDLKQFEGEKEDDTPNWIYLNSNLGIRYALFRNKMLTEVAVGPTKAQIQQYSCENKSRSSQIPSNLLKDIQK